MDLEEVRQAYASIADRYIELFSTPAQVPADDLVFVGRHLSGLPGMVLDAGCGPGHLTAYRWSVAEFAERLARAGFMAVASQRRPGDGRRRPQAVIAAVAA